MLRPLLGRDLPRPFAVVESPMADAIRYLPVARSVISLAGERVQAAVLPSNALAPVESLFGYPMGRLAGDAVGWQTVDADPVRLRNAWRVAIAAELAGTLKGGLDAVVAHVRERHQFGRPLGSFQALQHRLAGAATKLEGAYWLTLKAAQHLDPVATATALGYVQEAATRITNDLHQFMGAMGLTLEHPLHRWTYRARLLRSSMGGAAANFEHIAGSRWRAA